MVKVLGLGDNVCDVYLHTGIMYPGGQAVNFSVYARKLGAQSDFMGVFGEDAVADHVKAALSENGVGYSHCRSYEGENGFARVMLVEGDRVFKGSNQGGVLKTHPIRLDEADLSYVEKFDLIHTTNNGFTDSLLPALSALPPFISYDFSYRWNEEDRLLRVCPYVDFAFLSCSDLGDQETEELCRKMNRLGCGVVTATRGSKGAVVYDGTRFYRQFPDYVTPVDTMGAGDSFATAMLVTILQKIEEGAPGDAEESAPGDAEESAPETEMKDRMARGRKLWENPDFRRTVLPEALRAAAAFSASTCLVNGAFGGGVPVPESVRGRIYEGI